MHVQTTRESACILRANREAHLAKWGTDPCAGVTAGRSGGVGKSTGHTPTTPSNSSNSSTPSPPSTPWNSSTSSNSPLQLQVPGGVWRAVHSVDRPLEEAREWLATSRNGLNTPPAICVIGAGAGWVVDAVEELPGAIRILVLEPEPACAVAMFERRDLRELIEAGRLMVLTGPEFNGAGGAWRLFGRLAVDPPLLIHPVIAVASRAATVAAARLARAVIASARANENARRRFAAPYLLNTLRNAPSLASESDADALVNLHAGTPVVIAAAGPSLNRNIEELRPYRDRVVLVAVDTALRPMLAAGLTPDFVVSVDPAPANARHLEGLRACNETALVAEASVQRGSLEAFSGRTFFFRVAEHHPWPWLHASGLDVTKLQAWGSVLVTAFDLGVKLGGDPLIMIGADLAYTGAQPYCRGTVYEEDWALRVAAGEALPDIWRHAISMHPVVVERHGDESISTAPHFVHFRDGLLNAARSARARVINATGAGILRGGPVALLPVDAALGDLPRLGRKPLPRRGPAATIIETLRQNTIRLVQRLDPPNDGWGAVLAEHEPPDPTLPDQCESVRVALARWAGVGEGE